MKNKLTFKLTEDGITKEYFIIKMITNKDNNKNYIIYTENNDSKAVYASTFEINDNELKLHEIENDSEWDYVDSILSNIGEE